MGFWGTIAKITGIALTSAGGLVVVGSGVMLGLGANKTYETNIQSAVLSANSNSLLLTNNATILAANKIELKSKINWIQGSENDGNINLFVNGGGLATDYNVYDFQVSNQGQNATLKIKNTDTSIKLDFSSLLNSAFLNLSGDGIDWKLNSSCDTTVWQQDQSGSFSSKVDLSSQQSIKPLILDYSASSNGSEISGTLNTITISIDNNKQNAVQPSVDISYSSNVPSNNILEVKEGAALSITTTVTPNNITDPENISYQWFKDSTQISGQTTKDLNVNPIDKTWDGTSVKLVATYKGKSFESKPVQISVVSQSNPTPPTAEPSISIEYGSGISSPVTVDEGTTLSITTTVTPNNITDTQNISYQWQKSTDNGTSWTDIASQTSTTLTISNVDNSYNNAQVKLVATYNNKKFESTPVQISVKPTSTTESQKNKKITIGIGSINFGNVWADGKIDKESSAKIKERVKDYNALLKLAKDNKLEDKKLKDAIIQGNDLLIAGAVLVTISSLTLLVGITLIVINVILKKR